MPSFTDMLRNVTRQAERVSQSYPRARRLMDTIIERIAPESVRDAARPSAIMATVESAASRLYNAALTVLGVPDESGANFGRIVQNMFRSSGSAASAIQSKTREVVDQIVLNLTGEQGAITQVRTESAFRRLFTEYPSRIVDRIAGAFGIQRDTQGQPAQQELWQTAIDRHVSRSRANLRSIATELVEGKISPEQFRARMAAELRQLHIGAAILGAGGILNLSEHHMTLVDRRIREQMAYLDRFVTDIQDRIARGVPLGNRDIGRAGQYAASGNVMFSQAQRQFMRNETGGNGLERRVLGAAEHCDDCLAYAAEGWVPVGTLPPIGDSICGNNCQCSFEYDYQEDEEPELT